MKQAPSAAPPAFDAAALIQLRRATNLAVSPCGTWLAVELQRLDEHGAAYVSDLWQVPLDGRPPRQLTRGDHSDGSPRFRADGVLGFLSDRPTPRDSDSDRKQVWLIDGGEPWPLTDEPLGVSSFRFSPKGLVVQAPVLPGVATRSQRKVADNRKKHGPTARHFRRMPVRYWDHWLSEAAPHFIAYRADGARVRDLTPKADREFRNGSWDLSPDGTWIVTTRATEATDRVDDTDLVLLDIASSEYRTLACASRVEHRDPLVSPDGKRVVCSRVRRTNHSYGPVTLYLVEIESGSGRGLTDDFDQWATPMCWTPDSQRVIFGADDHGTRPVFSVSLDGAVTRLTAETASGQHTQVHALPDGRLAGLRSRFTHPPEPFVLKASPGSTPKLAAWLSGLPESLGTDLAIVEDVRVPVPGGPAVQAFVLHPRNAPDAPRPAIVFVHGGPMSQWTDGWHWRWNPLIPLAAGYTVILPNPSGSTGFGQSFIQAVMGRWGEQCYLDVMAVTEAVASRDDIADNRLVAMGGSFGGYMTNWIGVSTERFAALVTHASIFDLATFNYDTDYPAFWELEWGGRDPFTEREAYTTWSPAEHIRNWKTPALIIHGEKDYRCPIGESLGLFEALQRQGVTSELLIFPDEGHWITRPRNIVAWYGAVLEFLAAQLADAQASGNE